MDEGERGLVNVVTGGDAWAGVVVVAELRQTKTPLKRACNRTLNTNTNGTTMHVGTTSFWDGVVVAVDDSVEIERDSLGYIVELLEVICGLARGVFGDVGGEGKGSKIANSSLIGRRVFNDLGAEAPDVTAVLSSLEKRLCKVLPVYMVPSGIINLKHSGMELEVLAIFSSALGHPQESIGIQDSLFDLGGHSLTATLVVSAVCCELGVKLLMTSFFRNPTMQSVAAIIEAQGHGIAQDSEIPSISDNILANSHCCACPTAFIFPESTGIPSLYSTAFDCIPYRVVAFGDLRWGQPLQPDELVESIASTLVTEICKIQPTSLYFLVEWSLGGYLALEAAIQLKAIGASTKMVVMIDSSVYDRSLTAAQWRPDLDHLLGILDDKEQWNKAYRGRVELIKALRAHSGDVTAPIDNPTNSWGGILPQIKVHGFDALHRTMFSYENGPKMGVMIAILAL
ncbi:hypothetical protein BT96DRAFT_1084458 [Gymnopus androsaceus JB14]|uniref:Carrier domain-containing protein n=1 Tax=Gymnopus androsaceus JB14 TaxID=1447944 RepID=A0A6A4GLD5_9AGAR|nr:hypothetical protein BT96DRAFT_1084458 [Gymnopus androsaceus JB14]